MVNPWLAPATGADPAEHTRTVRRAHAAFLAGASGAPPVRQVVADSWRRSASAGAATDEIAPIDVDEPELRTYRETHPLARAMPLFRNLLGTSADDGARLLAICDAQGRLLWIEGHPGVVRQAERMNFVAGARRDERHAGTNAPGTALAANHPVQIFAAEDFNTRVQPWTRAAAPLHDVRVGRLLGAVDITGGDHLAGPHSLALVRAAAPAAGAHLAATDTAEHGGPRLHLTTLGRDEALLVTDGRQPRLGRRHSEIALLPARHPEGLTIHQLTLLLYGERDVRPVMLRAEPSRLRRLLGPALGPRPYRLCTPANSDLDAVERELTAGDLSAALRGCGGPPLPHSESPGVRRLRDTLETRLRDAVLVERDPAHLRHWSQTPWGEGDLEILEIWEALHTTLPPPEAGQSAARAQAARLRTAYGLMDRGSTPPPSGTRYRCSPYEHSAHATSVQRTRP